MRSGVVIGRAKSSCLAEHGPVVAGNVDAAGAESEGIRVTVAQTAGDALCLIPGLEGVITVEAGTQVQSSGGIGCSRVLCSLTDLAQPGGHLVKRYLAQDEPWQGHP